MVGATILVLYLVTIAPTTQFWDTSEYIASAKVLGIPHPPGNPLFVIVGHVWGMLPLGSHYALRINIFSAVCSALSSALLFLVAERFLRGIVPETRLRRLAAFAGVFVGATAFTVWNQSVVNAKVYTFSLLSIALVLWLTVLMCDSRSELGRKKLLILIAYLIALGATNHLMALLIGPAVAVYVLWEDYRLLADWRVWAGLGGAAVVGLSVFLFLKLRAPLFPPINEGEPGTWAAWWDVLMRRQFAKPPVTDRQADFISQLANYWQYFSWQFARDLSESIRQPIAIGFGATGLYGGWKLFRADRRAGLSMAVAMFTLTIALVFYLNFKYGFSIRPGDDLIREVRERDYFFVGSFQLLGIWVAVGIGAVMTAITNSFRERMGRPRAVAASSIVLLIALVPLFGNRLAAPRSGETLARDFAHDLLASVEPYGILVTAGDNDLFPLWYAQEVEGIRRDVLIANLSLMGTPWHLRQLQRREVFPYEPTDSDIWSDREWIPPTNPPFSLTQAGLDSLPPFVNLPRRVQATVGSMAIQLGPGFATRSDLALVQLVADNLGRRPIYFATTTGGTADAMGMGDFLVSYGLARRLLPNRVVPSDSVFRSPSLVWIDFPVYRKLALEVYHAESAARDRPLGWIDRPSSSVITIYGIVYDELGRRLDWMARENPGDSILSASVGRVRETTRRIVANLPR